MSRSRLILAAASAVLLAVGAHAQQQDRQPDFTFNKLDKNRDGHLTRQEASADPDVARIFSKADTNKDGKLTEDELVKARSAEDREKAAQYASDSAITTKAKTALLAEKGIKSTAISVETYKGVVQLSGFVDDAEQIRHAGAVVAKVGGVKSVKNSLSVK